jgi:hypothetical protein
MPQGAVRECGDDEFPGIYVRLDHPSVLDYIYSVTGLQNGIIKNAASLYQSKLELN